MFPPDIPASFLISLPLCFLIVATDLMGNCAILETVPKSLTGHNPVVKIMSHRFIFGADAKALSSVSQADIENVAYP